MELWKVVRFLKHFAPLQLAESWDNVGLLLEPSKCVVKKILLTNDLTESVFREALEYNANLIISYHPPIFSPMKTLTQSKWKDRIVIGCLENRIALYSPHTTWDNVQGGVGDWLTQAFKNQKATVSYIKPPAVDVSSIPDFHGEAGLGRHVSLDTAIPLEKAVETVKAHLGLKHVRVAYPFEGVDGDHCVKDIAFCAGSGASIVKLADYSKIDLVVTGEMSHHETLDAVSQGCAVILGEHSNTERGYLHSFKGILESQLFEPDLAMEAKVSQADKDPLLVV